MNNCSKCRLFLHDYLDQNLRKEGVLYSVANPGKIREHLDELIRAILRCSSALSKYTIITMKGELDIRTTFIKKPETKNEEYLLSFYILKDICWCFKEQLHQLIVLCSSHEFIKLKRTDLAYGRMEQFLANLFIPLIENLESIHTEHSVPINKIINVSFDSFSELYT